MATNNRIHPRVKAQLPAKLTVSDGTKLEVWLANISLNGVMIEATQGDFEAILVNTSGLNLRAPVEVDFNFNLPQDNGDSSQISVRCRAVYVRRQSQNKYFIGLKFLRIAQRSQQLVTDFVQNHLSHRDGSIAC